MESLLLNAEDNAVPVLKPDNNEMLLLAVWKIRGYNNNEMLFFWKAKRSLASKATNSCNLARQTEWNKRVNLKSEYFTDKDK